MKVCLQGALGLAGAGLFMTAVAMLAAGDIGGVTSMVGAIVMGLLAANVENL